MDLFCHSSVSSFVLQEIKEKALSSEPVCTCPQWGRPVVRTDSLLVVHRSGGVGLWLRSCWSKRSLSLREYLCRIKRHPAFWSPILWPRGGDNSAIPQLERKAGPFFIFLVEFQRTSHQGGSLWECLLSDHVLGLGPGMDFCRLGMSSKKQWGNSTLQMEMRFERERGYFPSQMVSAAKMEKRLEEASLSIPWFRARRGVASVPSLQRSLTSYQCHF